MEPLDLTKRPPRGPREKLLGLYFLPRTIDKMRAQLPDGNLGGYLVDFPRGDSAFLLKKIDVDLDEMKGVVASARDEDEVVAWIEARADLNDVEGLNQRLESLTTERLKPEDQAMVADYHPVCRKRPELKMFFDIFEADDAEVVASGSGAGAG